ncbi:MAG: hypothetical protein JRK53_28725 [Deltaproteobacteria bacterium]|nr:hypothetical protein [Deltaproteobacteria bacterium]
MKTEHYLPKTLEVFFKRHNIATLKQLQRALGDPKKRTVFRKLKSLNYLSSYSHRGMYYTLYGIAKFDAKGLWSQRTVWFSRFGNLRDTAKAFVEHSDAGCTSAELRDTLHVETKHCLVALVRADELERERPEGKSYVYFSTDAKKQNSQRQRRKTSKHRRLASIVVSNPDLAAEEAKAAVLLFISSLDERQRRLYAGLESLKLGYGGDHYIAELFGLDPHTVARGRCELEEGDWSTQRLRTVGGGRHCVEKKRRKS